MASRMAIRAAGINPDMVATAIMVVAIARPSRVTTLMRPRSAMARGRTGIDPTTKTEAARPSARSIGQMSEAKSSGRATIQIFVDGDACPVKAEVEKVAARHNLAVTIVSNGGLRPSANPLLRHVTVAGGAGAARSEEDKPELQAPGPT